MPPFREGPIKIDRRLSGEMLHFLRDVGHGHRINIVDASYDIPQGSTVIEYPGSTAEAFEAVTRVIPLEVESAPLAENTIEMRTDKSIEEKVGFDESQKHVASAASRALARSFERLRNDGIYPEGGWETSVGVRFRLDEDEITDAMNEGPDAEVYDGFYTIANNPDKPHTFIRTQDNLPFACVSLVVGHSQLTE